MQEKLLNDRLKGESFQIVGMSVDDLVDYLAGFRRSVGRGVGNGGALTFPWVACNTWIHIDHYRDVQAQWKRDMSFSITEYQTLALIDCDGVIRYLDWGGESISKKLDYYAAFDAAEALVHEAKAGRHSY